MAAENNKYRAKARECLSLAECMNDPKERAEIVRFARMWMNLTEPSDEAPGLYEFPGEAEKNSKLNLPFLRNELRKIYRDVLRKPVPSQLTSLLHRLEGQ